MRNIGLWRKLSNISAYTCGVVAIIHTLFNQDIKKFVIVFVIIEAVTIMVFLLSELMKFIIRSK